MLNSSNIVVESDIKNIEEIYPLLSKYCVTYANISRNLFNFIKDKKEPSSFSNELQREYIKRYDIQARVFKSIWRYTLGSIQSIKSNQENYEIQRDKKIKKLEDKLEKLEKMEKSKKSKKSKKYSKAKTLSYKFNILSKINRLKQINGNDSNVQSVWGSKSFFKKQWNAENHDLWLKEWKIRRDNNISIIGSSDESFGNSLCQLRSLDNLRLTLPKNFSQKHLDIKVDFNKDKKNYKYLKIAMASGKPLSFRIFQNSKNLKWYVQIAFGISNECIDLEKGTIGVDINHDLISTTIIKKDGNAQKFIDYRFKANEKNKNINRQTLSDIVNQIVDNAVAHKKTIVIEKISLKNVLKSKNISLVCYSTFISLLRTRCIKKGILLLEVNPAYTSVIGKLKYSKKLGISKHSSASLVIGRRGLEYVERIPLEYIYLLQCEEKSKSLTAKWDLINKRLRNVPRKKESLDKFILSRDLTTCNL